MSYSSKSSLASKEKTHETCSQDAGPDAWLDGHIHGRCAESSRSRYRPDSNVSTVTTKLRLVAVFGKVTKVTSLVTDLASGLDLFGLITLHGDSPDFFDSDLTGARCPAAVNTAESSLTAQPWPSISLGRKLKNIFNL